MLHLSDIPLYFVVIAPLMLFYSGLLSVVMKVIEHLSREKESSPASESDGIKIRVFAIAVIFSIVSPVYLVLINFDFLPKTIASAEASFLLLSLMSFWIGALLAESLCVETRIKENKYCEKIALFLSGEKKESAKNKTKTLVLTPHFWSMLFHALLIILIRILVAITPQRTHIRASIVFYLFAALIVYYISLQGYAVLEREVPSEIGNIILKALMIAPLINLIFAGEERSNNIIFNIFRPKDTSVEDICGEDKYYSNEARTIAYINDTMTIKELTALTQAVDSNNSSWITNWFIKLKDKTMERTQTIIKITPRSRGISQKWVQIDLLSTGLLLVGGLYALLCQEFFISFLLLTSSLYLTSLAILQSLRNYIKIATLSRISILLRTPSPGYRRKKVKDAL